MARRAPTARPRTDLPAKNALLRDSLTPLAIRVVAASTSKAAEESVYAEARDAGIPIRDYRLSLAHPAQFETHDHVPKALCAIEEAEPAGPEVLLIAVDTLQLPTPAQQARMVDGLVTFLLRYHPEDVRVVLAGSTASVHALRRAMRPGLWAQLEVESLQASLPAPGRAH